MYIMRYLVQHITLNNPSYSDTLLRHYNMSEKKVNTKKAHQNYPEGLRIVARLIAKKHLENLSRKVGGRGGEGDVKNLHRTKRH